MTLSEMETEARRLARVIGASPDALPTFGPNNLEEVPFVLHDASGYHLGYRERGQVSTETFPNADALLFAVFESIAQGMAIQATRSERRDDVDDRRRWYPAKVDLMRRLSPAWGERMVERQRETLRHHPFDDAALVRARLSRAYREQGDSNDAAWHRACARYPLPPSG